MNSDRHMRDIPVEHELTFMGRPARVLIEIQLDRNGATALIPVGDLTRVRESDRYTTLSVIQGTMLRRVQETIDDTEMHGL